VKIVRSGNGTAETLNVGSIIVATGFQHFDPGRETQMYGYYEYDDVITLADAEKMLKEHNFVIPSKGTPPQRVCFIQCVGSRDRQIGNEYCSKVCCGISSKQAIEIRQQAPNCTVFIFYIDMRMYGYWENEIYWPAQEKYHVQYVKGIITEITQGRRLLVRGEDTTMGRPMEVPMDVGCWRSGWNRPRTQDGRRFSASSRISNHQSRRRARSDGDFGVRHLRGGCGGRAKRPRRHDEHGRRGGDESGGAGSETRESCNLRFQTAKTLSSRRFCRILHDPCDFAVQSFFLNDHRPSSDTETAQEFIAQALEKPSGLSWVTSWRNWRRRATFQSCLLRNRWRSSIGPAAHDLAIDFRHAPQGRCDHRCDRC
jgi:hypothetical protein